MRKADLYIRVSTDEQADKGYSQRDQEDRLRKYCEIKGIPIRDVYIEDHSAKSFKRPEWQAYLSNLRKTKTNKSGSIILFTKWDRFSRNAGDAYQMINQLRKHGVEPMAIEQPLDLTIPENKIMLAFYLASPEVENDRRALNVFHGMRRAKKEGRYMGTAPLGYVNRMTEDKKKYIAQHDVEAPLLKWAFEQIIANNFNTEQIWKMLREKADGKGRFSKNNFWVALRNPLYCGKIFIPPYKEEKGYFVKGQHEPLISEKTFADVQDILDGRKRVVKPKIVAMDNLPLRGFLKCSKCDRMLTGSASKGKMGNYYYYYHCTSACGTRFKAETANEAFLKQLRYMSPKEGMVDVFIEAFIKDFNNKTKAQNTERTNIIGEIDALNKRYQNALLKNADGEMADDDFQEVKKLTKGKIENLERRLNDLAVVGTEIKDLVASALKKVANIDRRYENGDIEEKRVIVSSMFPDFLVFDGTQHRTPRLNSAIALIYQNNNKLQVKKNGTSLSFLDLSQEVTLPAHELFQASTQEHSQVSDQYFGCSVEEAVMITLEDADDIFQYIEELAGTGSFDSAFVNLDNNEYHTVQLSKKKAKGRRRKSWLRVYAIKIATDVFLITGGTIKLTKTMKEREHTQMELTKLEKCKSFLQENGIIDEDSFWELLDI